MRQRSYILFADTNLIGGEMSPEARKRRKSRKCKCCGASLNSYNPNSFCQPCDRAIQEWRNFPWRRGDLEREMAEHCLVFVREGLGKKKASGSSGEEISSASFTRASSRKTLERKKRPKGKKKRKRK